MGRYCGFCGVKYPTNDPFPKSKYCPSPCPACVKRFDEDKEDHTIAEFVVTFRNGIAKTKRIK